jgi:hypothetical protein
MATNLLLTGRTDRQIQIEMENNMNSNIIVLIVAAGTLALAQGPRGPQTGNAGSQAGGLDMAKVQTVEGTVLAVNVAYGSQYPSIQINQTTVKVAPVWFLLESDFQIKTGDKLKVTAAPSLQVRDTYLSAITITNTASGASITLRDSNGIPLWTRAQGVGGGNQERPGTCVGCSGPASVATVSGTVDQISAGIGVQMPSMVLKMADGNMLTVRLGPERILQAADFEIKAGDALTVRYAVTCTAETVALELTNSAGARIVLRNDDLTLAWR